MSGGFAALLLLLALGCGRSSLDTFEDGGPSRRDSMVDTAIDSPIGCTADGDCDDGFFCNGYETCLAGTCTAGEPVFCDDGVSCTVDRCVESSRGCESTIDPALCPPGSMCVIPTGCEPVGCTTDAECDDGFICDGVEVCVDGVCQPGPRPRCDDGIGCTEDACNEAAGGCISTPRDALCDDGLYCDGSESCDPGRGCLPGMAPNCSDGVACTLDSCDEATHACAHRGRDRDGDGFADDACGGDDCNDRNRAVNPGARERCTGLVD